MSKKIAFLLCLTMAAGVILAGCQPSGEGGTSGTPAEWLQENAMPFDTSEPGHAYDDLLPLKEIIGDARIVALGEATHGTREFFQMKHRLVEFLVEEMGFTIFAMEANWPEAELVNAYVQSCEGDPERLLSGLHFWTWQTEEVLDLLHWMCEYNQTPGGGSKVSFTGFDMQAASQAIDNVAAYFRVVDPPYRIEARINYSCPEGSSIEYGYNLYSLETKEACRAKFEEVYQKLVDNQAAYIELSTPEEYQAALHNAELILQTEDFLRDKITPDNVDLRDEYMAANVKWLLDHASPSDKIILWAHNGHVSRGTATEDFRPMGSHLHEIYGDEMIVVGFAFYEGAFNAMDITQGSREPISKQVAPPAPEGTHEWYFNTAGMPRMMINLRDIDPSMEDAAWLIEPHESHAIGSAYDESRPEDYFYPTYITQEFDILIFFRETTPSILLSERDK